MIRPVLESSYPALDEAANFFGIRDMKKIYGVEKTSAMTEIFSEIWTENRNCGMKPLRD